MKQEVDSKGNVVLEEFIASSAMRLNRDQITEIG